MKKNTITSFKLECLVRSYSHILNERAISLLMSGKTNIYVKCVTEKSFTLGCVNELEECKAIEKFLPIAHLCFSNYLMALNIATLGHFVWAWIGFPLIFRFFDPQNPDRPVNIVLQFMKQKEKDMREITTTEIQNSALLYGSLCKEDNPNVRREYIKGILHLSFDFFDIDFYKEAFGNFYRSFENFASLRIRGGKKLHKELSDFQNAIKDFGLGDEIAEEFGNLYKLRGEQIMHAQKVQADIKIDEALKMKTILDAILHRVYQPIWEKGMKELETDEVPHA